MDFQPGDKVVCISITSPCPCAYELNPHYSGELSIVIGRYYIVAQVGKGHCPLCKTQAPSFQPAGMYRWSWPQECFRKVEPGESLETLLKSASTPAPTPKVLEPA